MNGENSEIAGWHKVILGGCFLYWESDTELLTIHQVEGENSWDRDIFEIRDCNNRMFFERFAWGICFHAADQLIEKGQTVFPS